MNEQRPSHNLFLFLDLLAKRRTFIITMVLSLTLLATGISLVLPKWYKATTLLLPSTVDRMPVGKYTTLSQISSLTAGLELPALMTPADVYVRILKSRTISERIINQFDLQKVYGTRNMTETLEALTDNVKMKATDEGLINIEVLDRDPGRSASIANAFATELNLVSRELIAAKAREKREFIEGRLQVVKKELDSSRAELEQFQLNSRTVDFAEQTKLAMGQAMTLKDTLSLLEVDIELKEQTLGRDNPDLREKKELRRLLKNKLDQLETGGADSSFFALPLVSVPGLKGRYDYLVSRVQITQDLYAVLQEQFEQSKIQEQEASPNVAVIDAASVPELKSRPQRSLIIGMTAGLSLILSIVLAAMLNGLDQLQKAGSTDYERVRGFIRAYFGWLPGVRGRD